MDTEIYKNYLVSKLGTNISNKLSKALKDNGAIIAGGAVLGPYSGFRSGDIDIYVNIRNGITFLESSGINLFTSSRVLVPPYDQSFFRKNNILAKFRGILEGEDEDEEDYFWVDIMLIKDDIPVTQVASNFDLSFCQIWYNGVNVIATDENDIINKSGRLKADYVKSLVNDLNPFIIKRIQKYRRRGFKINIACNNNFLVENKDKTVVSDEVWVVSVLYNTMMKDIIKNEFIYNVVCTVKLQNYTINNLIDAFFVMNQEFNQRNIYKYLTHSIPLNESGINIISMCLSEYWGIYKELPDTYKDKLKNVFIDNNLGNVFNNVEEMDIQRTLEWERRQDQQEIDEGIDRYLQDQQEIDEGIDRYFVEQALERIRLEEDEEEDEDEVEVDYDINAVELLEYVVDERTLPDTCRDMYDLDDLPIAEYLDDDAFVFVFPSEIDDFKVLCFKRNYLQRIITDRKTNLFFECGGEVIPGTNNKRINNVIRNKAYVKMPIDPDGLLGYVPIGEISAVLESEDRVFYVFPRNDPDGNQIMITHSISWNNIYGQNPNHVSANHCQGGTSILVYTIKKCGGPNCLISR